jgi:outer membrane protein assembly factor BamA
MGRIEKTVVQSQNRASMEYPDTSVYKVGAKIELVYDATRDLGLNLKSGSRWKIFGEYFQPLTDFDQNTFVAGFDYRKYIKIHKNLIWANRAAGSVSLGSERLIYYLGGVDNWIAPKFNRAIQVDPDQNFAYQTLATNLRGFQQNIRNGNSFAAINSELRLPIFSFLSKKPIKNAFLNNFLIVGFFDVGTAWTGWNPFSDENSLYRYTVTKPPVSVTIINQNEPLVAGYGFGTRFSLFGYYIRLDWAYGIQNGHVGDRMFYLSLDLDF